MSWQREYPQSEGDWLWIKMWGCGCCVMKSGIAYIHEVFPDYPEEMTKIYWQLPDGKYLGISWEGQKPYFNDDEEKVPDITAWYSNPMELPYTLLKDWEHGPKATETETP